MKDIKYYENLNYKMTFHYEPEDMVYIVQFPELPGCIAHGKTAKEALKNAYRVKDEWLESAFDDKWIIPEPSLPLETTGRITLRIPKSIHQRIIDRAEEENISQNQLILTYISEGLERANLKSSIEEILQKQTDVIESINKYYELMSSNISMMDYYMPTISDMTSQTMATAANAITLSPLWLSQAVKISVPVEGTLMNRPTYFGYSRQVSANKESNVKNFKDFYKQKEDSYINDSNNSVA